MHKVERGQLWVMRLQAAAAGLVALAAATVAELVLAERTLLPAGSVLLPMLFLLVYPVLLGPGRRYRRLGYRIDAEELHVARGTWIHIDTIVPLARVQHLDVSQGPLERAFGVSRLVLHTAGTLNSLVVLPGLRRDTAESIRDEIRARVRLEPE
jgi:hypothetical protein